jgi:hypothetical protein
MLQRCRERVGEHVGATSPLPVVRSRGWAISRLSATALWPARRVWTSAAYGCNRLSRLPRFRSKPSRLWGADCLDISDVRGTAKLRYGWLQPSARPSSSRQFECQSFRILTGSAPRKQPGNPDLRSEYRQKHRDTNSHRGSYDDLQKRPRIAEPILYRYSRRRGENRMANVNF